MLSGVEIENKKKKICAKLSRWELLLLQSTVCTVVKYMSSYKFAHFQISDKNSTYLKELFRE